MADISSLNSWPMPNSRRPYIRQFSAVDNSVSDPSVWPVHKTRSTDFLAEKASHPLVVGINAVRPTHSPVRHTKSQDSISLHSIQLPGPERDLLHLQYGKQLEQFREKLELPPFRKKYKSVTIPTSVRYSTMSGRPKSPPKNGKNGVNEQQQDRDKVQSGLDQTLLRIKQQLNLLSTERTAMELQMEELTSGINQARHQCHNQCSRQLNMNASSIRRTHSSVSPRMVQRKIPQSKVTSSPSPQETRKSIVTSPTLSLPEQQGDSPEVVQERQRSASTSESPQFLHKNYSNLGTPISTANTSKLRVLSLTLPDVSLSQGSEAIGNDCFSNYTIPELPESPNLSSPLTSISDVNTKTTRAHSYSSNTAPRPHSSRRSYSTSSPRTKPGSTPDISKATAPKLWKPPTSPVDSSNKKSLPEHAMNKIIEDEVDTGLSSNSLSQANSSQLSTDDSSPKRHGSTLILRRSSLTGQVEHIRRPRFRIKPNSFNGSADCIYKPGSKSNGVNNMTSMGQEYRVLNTGFRSNRRSRILPNSIETTV